MPGRSFTSYKDIVISPLSDDVAAALAVRGMRTPASRGRWPRVAEIRRILSEFPRREYGIVYRPKQNPDPGDLWYVSFDYSWDQDSDLRSETVLRLQDRYIDEEHTAAFRFDRGVPRVIFTFLQRLSGLIGPMVVFSIEDKLSAPVIVHAGTSVEQLLADSNLVDTW